MRLSLIEAVFCALGIGLGEVYFVADAIRLGANTLEKGLVVTLPLSLGTLGPMLALLALRRLQRRRVVVVSAVFAQATVLLAVAFTGLFDLMTPWLLILLACGYQLFGQASGTAWSSWYGDLVPVTIRGTFFAQRTRIVHLTTSLALLASGLLLEWLEPGAAGAVVTGAGGAGFALIFGLAGVCRGVSGALLVRSPEPVFSGLPKLRSTFDFLGKPAGLGARRLLGVACGLQLLVYVSSPYFAPYMLEELKLSYVEYMLGSLAVVLFKFLSLPAWGRSVDHYGARPVYLLAALLIAIVPVPWLWTHGIGWVIAAQCLSGISWGGHEIGHFALLLETSEPGRRPHIFAAMNVVNGAAQLAGSLLGAWLLGSTGQGYQLVFATSIAGRLAIAAIAPRVLPLSINPKAGRRRHVFLSLLGWRTDPSGP